MSGAVLFWHVSQSYNKAQVCKKFLHVIISVACILLEFVSVLYQNNLGILNMVKLFYERLCIMFVPNVLLLRIFSVLEKVLDTRYFVALTFNVCAKESICYKLHILALFKGEGS